MTAAKLLISLGVATLSVVWAEQIEVTSNEMQAFDERKEVRFVGDANATQGNNWIHGDAIIVYLTSENKAKEYVATGHVTFELNEKSGYYRGKASKVTYDPNRSLYILSGGAVVDDLRNKRHLSGSKIVLNALTGKAKVTGDARKGKRKRPVKFRFETGNTKKVKK